MQHRIYALGFVLLTACTTLGPMPATTGISALPAERPSGEIQTAVMPVFYLSDTTRSEDANEKAAPQISALFEPDHLLGTKGLILGARAWGEGGDSPVEPMIGMRLKLHEHIAIAGIAYGTHVRGESNGANYRANRLGGELAVDALLLPMGALDLRLQATVAATYIGATGRYCVGSDGEGSDCDDGDRQINGEVAGTFPSATAGAALDIARQSRSVFHGVRLAFLAAIGETPRLRNGIQQPTRDTYRSFGVSVTVGLGERR